MTAWTSSTPVVASSTRRVREGVRDDHTGLINTQMEFLPPKPATASMFRRGPFTLAGNRQARAVDDEMKACPPTNVPKREIEVLATPGQRRVIRRAKIGSHHDEERLVGVDGRGGSGKTSLARSLAEMSSRVRFVSLRDFYIPVERQITSPPEQRTSVDDTDHPRLLLQVIKPLRADLGARYQRWDWDSETLARSSPGGLSFLRASVPQAKYCGRSWTVRCGSPAHAKRGCSAVSGAMESACGAPGKHNGFRPATGTNGCIARRIARIS